jgi:4'-phosphopantetheinyl transferase
MPLVRLDNTGGAGLLGLWRITESCSGLEEMLPPNVVRDAVAGFRSELRRRQRLACRALLARMPGGADVEIAYHASGKPYMKGCTGCISMSHSGDYAALLWSPLNKAGIDIEKVQARIVRLAHKFLSEEELALISREQRIPHMILHWAAKEALYKLQGDERLTFDRHMRMEAFIPAAEGSFNGMMIRGGKTKEYVFRYFFVDDYAVVWVTE